MTASAVAPRPPWTTRRAHGLRLALAAGLLVLAVVNGFMVAAAVRQFLTAGQTDWLIFEFAADRIASGADPYVEINPALHHAFRWSPIAAWLLVPLTAMPYWAWAGLHLAALAAFRDWRLAALIAVSWPFALDVFDGGIMIFVALAGYWAYRGGSLATAGFLALALLVPRPIMLPLLLWILWRRPEWRVPFVVAAVAHLGAVVATGWHVEWLERLLVSGQDVGNIFNLAPSRFVGALWVPLAVAAAAALLVTRRVGLASVLISPYVLPPYLLMLAIDLRSRGAGEHRRPS